MGVTSIVDTTRENRLSWFEHVKRKEKSEAVKTVMDMNVEAKRGKPKTKNRKRSGRMPLRVIWRTVGVCVDNLGDCVSWR